MNCRSRSRLLSHGQYTIDYYDEYVDPKGDVYRLHEDDEHS